MATQDDKKEDTNISKSQTLEAFVGLWDDYADRSIGWGGFFVASMFGMYSLLGIIDAKVPGFMWVLVYFLLWGFGAYSLANFLWYFELSNCITEEVRCLCPDFKSKLQIMLNRNKRGFYSLMHSFSRWRERHPKLTSIILFSYYIGITWVPLFVVLFWLKSVPFF